MNNLRLDQIPSTAWAELVSTKFRVQIEGTRSVELTLTNVNHGQAPLHATGELKAPKTESFSLLFKGPVNPTLRQKIYNFEHDRLGRFDLFIVPTARGSGECEYEAVFTRLAQSGQDASHSA